MFAMDLGPYIQALLFALFAGLTAIVTAITGPTYDQLLVPELSPGALYPPLAVHPLPGAGFLQLLTPQNYLSEAAQFSTYLLVNIVDPAIALVAVGVAVLYLARSFIARWAQQFDDLLPRLVIAIVVANFTLPILGAILSLGSTVYPVFADWDGGQWQHWVNLAGYGQLTFSWDNGALAFVLSMVEFALVFGLVLAIGVRDALLAVLVVLLPIFTLLWPFRPLAPLTRRAWFLFVELVFLPCVTVVPLQLAVNSSSAVMLVGFLGCALASPFLLSLAGTHLAAFGSFASASTISSGTQRGFSATPSATSGYLSGISSASSRTGIGAALTSTSRAAGSTSAPAAAPLAAAHVVGHGAAHLLRHLRSSAETPPTGRSWPAVRPGG